MGNPLTAIEWGLEYQAMVFWEYANRMLYLNSNITSVSYEYREVRSFDDVVVKYTSPEDYRGERMIEKDFIQVKYHVTNESLLTIDDLLDPKQVNAVTNSFMDNVVRVYKEKKEEFLKCRFILYTTSNISNTDVLGSLISNSDGSFRLDILLGEQPRMRELREKLKTNLGVTDEDLKAILQQVCIYQGQSIVTMKKRLQDMFEYNRLKMRFSEDTIHYTTIIRSWMRNGRVEYLKSDIVKRCTEENLFISDCAAETVVVRSLGSDAHKLKENTATYLNLMTYFNERELKKEHTWEDIYKAVTGFVEENMSTQKKYYLDMPAHYSIVFMLGRVLNPVEGFSCMPAVRAAVDSDFEDLGKEKDEQEFQIADEILDESASDVALAISITHNISFNVKEYITKEQLKIRRMIMCEMPRCSGEAVKSGRHIQNLSVQIGEIINQRSIKEKEGIMHIFVSVPKEIMFYLGKKSRTYGRIQLYEYNNNSTYAPFVAFPIGKPEDPDRKKQLADYSTSPVAESV